VGPLAVGPEIALLPFTEIVFPMGRAMFSVFALAHRSGEDVEAIFRRLVAATATMTMPASIGLALIAAPLVHLTLGPTWTDAVPLLQVVAVGGVLASFGQACHAQFDAFGLLRQDFIVILLTGALRAAAIAFLVPQYGLLGGAVGLAISLLLEPIIYLAVQRRRLRFSGRALAAVGVRPLLATCGMAVALTGLDLGLPASDISLAGSLTRLVLALLVGGASYLGLLFTLWWLMRQPAGIELDTLPLLRRLRPTWKRRRAPA
jgi:O-antigen/teichoic acid export membrane protein